MIGGKDIKIVTVGTGSEALEKLREEHFDCAIVDLMLPDLEWPAALLPLFSVLLVAAAVAFVAIQLWIVFATDKSLTQHADAMREFRLERGREVVLTALPIALTLLLILVALPTVRALF